MSEAKTQAAPFSDAAKQAGDVSARHLLTIGSGAAFEIGRRLAIGWQHENIPHATWPSLGGDALPLTKPLNEPAFDRIRAAAIAEADKSLVTRIKAVPWDIVLMSTGAHVGTTYAVDGARCIPDFTQAPWLSDIDLAGARRPNIGEFAGQGVQRVHWLDAGFTALAKSGFDRFYERALRKRIAKGGRVFVYRQLPARWALTSKGLERVEVPGIAEMEMLSNALADHAAAFKGVTVMDTPGELNFTSDDAIDGRGPLNAIDEQFVHLASRIAHALGDPLEGRIIDHHLLEMRRERIALEWEAVGDTRQRERDLEAIVRALIDRSAMLERDILIHKRTLSWRITKPLRIVRGLVRRAPARNG